ncbi:MAG TPA: hypothetical protein VIF11_17940 [Methylomirabilota bacterium]
MEPVPSVEPYPGLPRRRFARGIEEPLGPGEGAAPTIVTSAAAASTTPFLAR